MKSARQIRIVTSLSIGVVVVSAFAWLGLGHITGSLKRVDAFAGLNSRPEKASSAVNYLLVGSDTREGLTPAELKALRVGSTKSAAGQRSDTMLLVHISKARDKAVIISLPRDTLVTIPQRIDINWKDHPRRASKTKFCLQLGWSSAFNSSN